MYPQVLLLGNGLNRAYDSEGWDGLIKNICCNKKIDPEAIKDVAFPLRAVLATDDHIDNQIAEKKKLFYGLDSIDKVRPMLERVLRVPFDHILTTNYSYEIERVADDRIKTDGIYCRKLARSLVKNGRVEQKYLLHSYNDICFEEKHHKIWHIHGEARKPQSIVLGHYYYGRLLNGYIECLRKIKNKQYERQQAGEPISIDSWLDAFIMGDVYILGFGFDYSEMDLWWLLNRKKREKAEHGKVYFYEPSQDNEIKHSLLDAYGADVLNLGYYAKPGDYKSFYNSALDDIQSKVLSAQIQY